jgi:hypothetical protein
MVDKISRREVLGTAALGMAAMGMPTAAFSFGMTDPDEAIRNFVEPPDEARPWVYWYFMDGHLRRAGMDADLAAMKRAGLGGAIYLEVGIGMEPGPVEFMSPPWQSLLGHAFEQADRLGLQMSLAAGPGWCGTGGPWVTPDRSMQHLVASKTLVRGPTAYNAILPQPPARTPFFGVETLTPELLKVWREFYRDEFVLAFPTPEAGASIADVDEKALYTRGSYSSQIPGPFTQRPWVRPFLPSESIYEAVPAQRCVASGAVVNLTGKLSPDGMLAWSVPSGNWTILRFGRTLTGQTTRPSPKPGLGLESDKFDAAAMDAHFDAYIVPLLKSTGAPQHPGRGLVALHFDSWEMSSQNWSPHFHGEFKRRRGYDPLALLPTFAGFVVDTPEVSERFLWDIRQTASELVCENQAERLRQRGQQYGLSLELEPYDLNPSGDLDLGATADVPMAEFWTRTPTSPLTDFSLAEAASVGHTQGHKIIGAEAFTANMDEQGHQHPASMKAQGDWAFCQGINRLVIHRYQAQPWLDRRPGMTMGPDGGYGVHWERTQTWWDFVPAYHQYLSRCQQMLRRGLFVADILYLTPEGAPNVFFPPRSAFRPGTFADRRGYNFDGCAPQTLIARAAVKDGHIVFPDGMSYRILVLPRVHTMTPRVLEKIAALVEAGATVLGAPPQRSPSLSNYPECDQQVRELAARLWLPGEMGSERPMVRGRVIRDSVPLSDHAHPLAQASWIWCSPDAAASITAGGTLVFDREFSIENARMIETALLTITADESYELSLNSRVIAAGNAAQRARRIDISGSLGTGTNQLTVAVKANRATPGQSGLVASLAITLRDGNRIAISTDREWTCSTHAQDLKSPATKLGPYNMPPWNLTDASVEQADIYPSYAQTAELLEQMGVEPDFEADAPFRFIHRNDGDEDFYFIANGEDRPQNATCRFRVTGRQPQWWDAVTGERRDLPEFTRSGGRTDIPIRLDPFESGFVVFRKPATEAPSRRQVNFPQYESITTLTAPWKVRFDPMWGGPEQIVFSALEDWSKRPEPGIRYYSGKATYKTAFDCDQRDNHLHHFLSLGQVANIASVKINDRDLGVLWCKPWRIAIPAGLLRPRGNALEITVANLWINRLIGDSRLPENQRLTRITSNPFHPEDPLLESGLLGPVVLQVSRDAQ